MTARRIVIYLEDDLPDGTTEIILRRGPAPARASDRHGAGTPEEMLARLKANGRNSINTEETYGRLQALGMTPELTTPRTKPGPEPWINWRKDGSTVVCALDSGSVTFQRAADTPKIQGLPGAVVRGDGTTRLPIRTPDQVKIAIEAVKRVI